MSTQPDPNMRLWVETWKRAGPELERIRRQELRLLDTVATVEALADFFDLAVAETPPGPTSGLVEQQRWFQRLR